MDKNTVEPRINDQILRYFNNLPKLREVRLIDENGEQQGVILAVKALEQARSLSLDLIEISPKSEPPVCKIMDYGKFKYLQSKKTQEARKKQTVIQVKEVKFRPKIEDHDVAFKVKNIRRFLAQKDKIKVSLIFTILEFFMFSVSPSQRIYSLKLNICQEKIL